MTKQIYILHASGFWGKDTGSPTTRSKLFTSVSNDVVMHNYILLVLGSRARSLLAEKLFLLALIRWVTKSLTLIGCTCWRAQPIATMHLGCIASPIGCNMVGSHLQPMNKALHQIIYRVHVHAIDNQIQWKLEWCHFSNLYQWNFKASVLW